MMYKLKEENKDELKAGRTLTYLSDKLGCTISHLSLIFCQKRTCTKSQAIALISICNKISEGDIDEKINYYFDDVK